MKGFSCYPKSDSLDSLVATIDGPESSAYSGHVLKLSIDISENYPFEPPRVTFQTPIYHPNIDNKGRICLDLLNMPPKGRWRPTFSLQNLLHALRDLLANPNADDPLMADIAQEYKMNRQEFERKARKFMTETNSK